MAQEESASAAPEQSPTLVFPKFANERTIHMVAYGDMRFTDAARTSGTNPRARKYLAEKVGQENPEVLLLTGDMPYTGANPADWQVFQNETTTWRAGHTLQLPTIGNHEAMGGKELGIKNYLDNFPDIGMHRYYSALLGNVEVISLDMTIQTGTGGEQPHWFASQLEHVPKQVDFLMIMYHMPWMADEQSQIFANLPSPDALVFRDILEAHLDRIRARVVVFNGHIHNYERFERRGVEYVISGGGGAEPYPILVRGPADLYRDTGFPVFHYLTLEVTGRTLHAVMWKVKDPKAEELNVEAKDEFTLQAPAKAAASAVHSKPRSKAATH